MSFLIGDVVTVKRWNLWAALVTCGPRFQTVTDVTADGGFTLNKRWAYLPHEASYFRLVDRPAGPA